MHGRRILTVLALLLGGVVAVAPAATAAGTTYTWVGGSATPQGDNTSWTDPDNWSPNGVPGNGDSVSITPPTEDVCNAHVTGIPTGLQLANLVLADRDTAGSICDASLADGSISVSGTFAWHAGVIGTPITLLPTATGTISPLAADADVTSELDADLDVQGTLDLVGNVGGDPDQSLALSAGTTITVAPGAVLDTTGGNDVTSLSCCSDPAHVVNQGTITAHDELAFDYVELDQQGTLDADGSGTEITSWAAPTTSADGAVYTGGGTYRVSGASLVDTLTGTQHVGIGTTFALGGGTRPYSDPPVPAYGNEGIAGTFTVTGAGTFRWDGGTIAGQATISTSGGVAVGGNAEPKYAAGPGNAAGSLTLAAPTTVAGGTAQNPTSVSLINGSDLTLAGTTHVGAGVDLDGGHLTNTGHLVVAATTKNPTSVTNAGLVNRGPVDLTAGVLHLDGVLAQQSGTVTVDGGTKLVASAVRETGGQLRGTGTFDANVAVTSGQVAPGTAGSVGTLTVAGNLTLAKGATTLLDEATHRGDLIAVTGRAALGGTASVRNTFRPTRSSTRTALTAHTVGGHLACVVTTGSGTSGRTARHWTASTVRNHVVLHSAAGRRTRC